MNVIFKWLVLLLGMSTSMVAIAGIQSKIIHYQIAGQPFQGYLSYDDAISGKRPGIVVVHEWWGHNAYARNRADMLAKLGYTAFALDMYGEGKLASHPDDAKKFMQATMSDLTVMENRFNEAVKVLKKQPTVDANKIAGIGYCFGGGVVLHMAVSGVDLAGVVSFHGSLASAMQVQPARITSSVLVLNGAEDPFVTPAQISALKQKMAKTGVDFEFVNYPGVKHSFTNPDADRFGRQFNMPLAYDAEADRDSWHRMKVFFQKIFQ
ncbi:MAG TPA: dienelactone hydrolase family protein [Crenotrichaceae bacterium]|nr:dienelactone hydrolase family protein [Crenotrichaceae bacterium]